MLFKANSEKCAPTLQHFIFCHRKFSILFDAFRTRCRLHANHKLTTADKNHLKMLHALCVCSSHCCFPHVKSMFVGRFALFHSFRSFILLHHHHHHHQMPWQSRNLHLSKAKISKTCRIFKRIMFTRFCCVGITTELGHAI